MLFGITIETKLRDFHYGILNVLLQKKGFKESDNSHFCKTSTETLYLNLAYLFNYLFYLFTYTSTLVL